MVFTGTMTIFIAGLSAVQEIDIKKVVALSTLSQLGLIIRALGIAQPSIAFFHLLSHAFIKALLFIAIGNFIHFSNDYQDIRKVKIQNKMFPLSRAIILISNMGLCGLPFLAGFYSKDLWLEYRIMSLTYMLIYHLFIVSTSLTVVYSRRLVYFLVIRGMPNFTYNLVQDKRAEGAAPIVTL